MFSIKEVNYFTKLVQEGKADQLRCPFDKDFDKHIVMSKVDDDDNVLFKCLNCQVNIELGLETNQYIKKSIDKFSK
jgi:hypothetical protein